MLEDCIFNCQKMVVYEVFAQRLKCSYRSTLCSKATAIILVCTFLTAFLPLIISYRSSGFWLKTDTFMEQPRVKFDHDYMLLIETGNAASPIFCSSQYVLGGDIHRHCAIRSHEIDMNYDGRADEIDFNVKVPLHENESVYSLNLLLPLTLGIDELSQFKIRSMALLQYSAGIPGLSYDGVADLRFVQKKPVGYFQPAEYLYVQPLFYDGTSLREIYVKYAQRNYSTALVNQYDVWIATRPEEELEFEVNFKLIIPENSFTYRPGFWQVMKWAWMQYISVLIVFIYIFHLLQELIFTNQLVPTCTFVPWLKPY